MEQLHLPIELRREPRLERFHAGPNAETLAAVHAMGVDPEEPFVFLHGPPRTGKSHLLQGSCLAARDAGRSAQYLDLSSQAMSPAALDDLEHLSLVALDDLEAVAGRPEWDRAVFRLFNDLRRVGGHLLIAAASPPGDLPIGLPDLASRLRWGPSYALAPLTEAHCEALLLRAASEHGLRLSPGVARYILNHYEREPAYLVDLIERLDSHCLRLRRAPTIELVKAVAASPRPDSGHETHRVQREGG